METTTKERNKKTISVLNDLLEINNDRVEGYEKAISETNDEDLAQLFTNMAAHSRTYRSDLSKQIVLLQGEPTKGTKNSGKLFRAWMDVKAALTAKDRKEILKSCEFGEDAALDAYKTAIEDKDSCLSESLCNLIKMQKQEIQIDHDRIKALRDFNKKI